MREYSSRRQYAPVIFTFGVLLLLCVCIGVYRTAKPEEFTGNKMIKITFDYGSYTRAQTVKTGLIEEPQTPTQEGYLFDGWFVAEDGEEERAWNFGTDEASSDVTLYARWSAIPYTVTLNANGGSCQVKTLTVYVDRSYTLPTPTRPGYFFAGWYRIKHLCEEQSGVWTYAEDCTMTAAWTTFPYGKTVTFGCYEQDNVPETPPEDLEWLIIDEQDGNYMLISKRIVEACPFEQQEINDWTTSALREFLNNDFYTSAFTAEERSQIVEGYLADFDCTDRVFVLNEEEANELLLDYRDAQGIPTAYALKRGTVNAPSYDPYNGELMMNYEKSDYTGFKSYFWAVRDRSQFPEPQMYSFAAGGIAPRADYVPRIGIGTRQYLGVRPVIWVNWAAVD